MKYAFTLIMLLFAGWLFGQNPPSYFPPTTGNTWATQPISDLGWQQQKVDSLLNYLDARHSNSFIVLHQGKIVIEHYFGTFTQDSFWYWASAGKSLTGLMVGAAQEKGLLSIEDSTSQYLGVGWTSCTPEQEGEIKIRHQLTMTTGLDDRVPDTDCLADTCLLYFKPPGDRWAYYNAPYRLLLDVMESASGLTMNQFTNQWIGNKIGMGGFWFNRIRYGKARDMARFGLLTLNKGIWNGDTVLGDTTYFHNMTHPSQALNPSYGYLWWLNGQSFHLLPGLQFPFQGPVIPEAPADMYSALGKNDQKIYVVPSLELVVVRQGDAAYNTVFALSSFDDELWAKIMDLYSTSSVDPIHQQALLPYPNPADTGFRLDLPVGQPTLVKVFDVNMRLVGSFQVTDKEEIATTAWQQGLYLLQIEGPDGTLSYRKLRVKH